MSERKISTRLVVEGEKEYKSSIANINRELKTLESALKLTESNFKGQANTIAALEAKNKALNDVIGKTAEKLKTENAALDTAKAAKTKYAEAAEAARKKLDELQKTTDSATKETEEYAKQVAVIQAEINKYEAAEQKAAAAVETHSQKANKAQIELNNFNGQLADNEKYLDEAKQSTDGAAKSIDEFGKQTDKAGKKSEEFGDKSQEAISELSAALAAAGVVATLKEIADALTACSDASIQFESAMAGVAKTTDLSQEELAAMGEAIKEITLTVPIAASEFANIAEVAGQLGIEKENLLDFSTVMANLGVATNMTSDEAATMLAQFAAITGMDAGGFGRLGSAIVALGNNFATNEKKITDMAQGIAGAGTNAKISEADMLALSAAVTSLGIETAAGGTSMSKLITDMGAAVETGKDLNLWAEAAGMSASQFAALWGTDATAAISAFLGNLNNLNDSSTVTLSNLGITETRMVRMITSLSNAENKTGLLTKALNTSNDAWKQNTALVKEAETRYKTTESQITLYKNSMENLKIAVGDQLNPALANLAKIGKSANEWAADFIKTNSAIVPLMTGIVVGIGVFITTVTTVTVILPKVITLVKALNVALAANPWILAATAIAAVVAALVVFAANAEESTKAAQDFRAELDATAEAHKNAVVEIEQQEASTAKLVDRLNELIENTRRTAAENAEMQSIITELNNRIDGLNLAYDENTGALNRNIKSAQDLIKARYNQIKADEMLARGIEIIDEKVKVEGELTKAYAAQEAALLRYNDARAAYNEVLMNPATASAAGGFYQILVNAESALDDATGAVNVHLESLGALDAEYATVTAAVDGFTGAAATGTQALDVATAESVESIKAQMVELTAAYDAAYKAAYEGISSTISGFNRMGETVPTDIQKIIDALNSQSSFMDTYMENLAKAAEMGLDKGLLAELSDGSVESARILAGIVEDGGAKVEELNENFRKVQEGKEDFAETVAEMQTEFDTAATELVTRAETMVAEWNQYAGAYASGAATIQGYIDGLNSRMSEVSGIIEKPSSKGKNPGTPKNAFTHAQGLDRVPYDGYYAMLHEDEMVLNRARASEYRANMRAGRTNTTNNTSTVINHNSFFVPTKAAYDDIAQYIDRKWGNQ